MRYTRLSCCPHCMSIVLLVLLWLYCIRRTQYSSNVVTCEVAQRMPLSDSMLTADHLARSYHPGDSCYLNNIFHSLDHGHHVDIVFIGGSMTKGTGCLEDSVRCSWPDMFAKWINSTFPHWNITVKNLAVGGYSSYIWSTTKKLRDIEANLVVLDFAVNSAIEPPEVIKSGMSDVIWSLHKKGIAVLSMETFNTCAYNVPHCLRHCAPHTIRNMSGYHWCEAFWNVQTHDYQVLNYFDTIFASYRDAVWPTLKIPPVNLPIYWSNSSHPDSIAHRLVARVMEYTILEELKLYCKNPRYRLCFRKHKPLTNNFYCVHSKNFTEFSPVSMHESWSYYEDVQDKPGWINTSNTTGSITFDGTFIGKKQLEITYVKSYDHTGEVIIQMKCGNDGWKRVGKISAEWGRPVTIPFVTVFVSSNDSTHTVIPLEQKCLIRLEMGFSNKPTNKFKIISVAGC